ncbi:rod shape-determining protein MreC [Myxococcota bacterium]|nr:rod shape-determining protein MreC [Myxococcota bacterium]MBU1431084.1 rod shape-determining protein MreC [Myxococcota bacterium]MBU1896528.1 rod shape-determining protein MreC [Myxococcota bacterium]
MRTSPSARRTAVLLALLICGAIALLKFDPDPEGHPGPVGRFALRTMAPSQALLHRSGARLRGLFLDYLALVEVRAENKRLEARIRDLEDKGARWADLVVENERLHRLLELADRRKDLRLHAARVVARGVSEYFRVISVTLDLHHDRVTPGMPVIAPGGVVGQIRAVTEGRAEVLLLTDPRSAIDVVLEQSRARGVAVGTGQPDQYAARLEYLDRHVKAVAGERVMTTGDDGRYPRGLVVGEVRLSDRPEAAGPFQDATVRPKVDLSALDEVFVVLGPSGLSPEGDELAPIKEEAPP